MTNRPSGHQPLDRLLREFRIHRKRHGDSEGTIRQREWRLRAISLAHAPRHVLDLDALELEEWMDSLPGRDGGGLKDGSRHTYVTQLRAFYGWAHGRGLVAVDVGAGLVGVKAPMGLPRPARDEVVADAMDRADPRMLAFLALGAYEGFRCVEMSRLRGEHVSVPAMSVWTRGKGGKERVVPLHEVTLDALVRHGLPSWGWVFRREARGRHQQDGPLHPQTISRYINRHLPAGTTAHQLRHWFGTEFYRESLDLLLTAEAMGHSSTRTTQGYAKADTTRAAAVVGRLRVRRSTDGEVARGAAPGGKEQAVDWPPTTRGEQTG